jgi:hypothetical protein
MRDVDSLRYRLTRIHRNWTRPGVGRIVVSRSRFTLRVVEAYYFPQGDGLRYDVHPSNLRRLMAAQYRTEALHIIGVRSRY